MQVSAKDVHFSSKPIDWLDNTCVCVCVCVCWYVLRIFTCKELRTQYSMEQVLVYVCIETIKRWIFVRSRGSVFPLLQIVYTNFKSQNCMPVTESEKQTKYNNLTTLIIWTMRKATQTYTRTNNSFQ